MSNLVLARDIEPENVEWLWRERLPRRMFALIAGRPDTGKSMMASRITADITRDGGNVLYSSMERSFGIVERPRLEAAGAVLSRITAVGLGTGYTFTLPKQLDELAQIIRARSIDLVVMDPVSAHFRGVSRYSDNIRDVLSPLAEVMEAENCSVLFIEHALKKVSPHAEPLAAIGGSSSGLPAVCAMAYLFGTNPSNEDQKVLACVKHNLTDRVPPLAFEIDEVDIDGLEAPAPALVFDEELEAFSAIRLVSNKEDRAGLLGRPPDKRADAAEWLSKYLFKAGKPVKGSVIIEDAKQLGIVTKTLRRAADDVGVIKNPKSGPNVHWQLPASVIALLSGDDEKTDGKTEAPSDDTAGELLTSADLDALLGSGDNE